MNLPRQALQGLSHALDNVAKRTGRPPASLLAVSKTQPAAAIEALAACGQRAFGENYVQEAAAKIAALQGLALEWHLIGHLQSNKCRDAARLFNWVQSLDRLGLVEPLNRSRDAGQPPLNVLIQVNPDGEQGKFGCAPDQIAELAAAVLAAPKLRLRGLMAIPEPSPDPGRRRQTFHQLRAWFDQLRAHCPSVDTLSMGMSEDFEMAAEEGATMVRIGSALFGPRH